MKTDDLKNLAIIGALGVGAYFLYRLVSGTASVVTSAGQAVVGAQQSVASKVADIAEKLFPFASGTPAGMKGANSIVLGDGSEIPPQATQAAAQFTASDGSQAIQFYYAGHTYRTTSATPDDTGTLYAAMVS